MAKQMSYTDDKGNFYPQAYFRPVQINMGIADKSAYVVFYGYKDAAARQAGKALCVQKIYSISNEKYADYFSPIALDTLNPIKQSYKLCIEIKDVESGQLDVNGKPIMKSFFEGSIDV